MALLSGESERRTQKRSSSRIEELPEELKIEILCRVFPYKHLMRCKCVSKRCLFLISNYRFHSWTHMYMNKIRLKPASNSVLVEDSRFKSKGFSLSFLPCYQPKPQPQLPIYVYNTLDGLFLCSAPEPHLCNFPQNIYYVCNPLTLHWVALPPNPHKPSLLQQNMRRGVTVKLIHDHDDSERFQVVRVYRRLSDTGVLMVEIFSFEAAQWICRDVVLSVKNLSKWTTDIEITNGTLYVAWSKYGALIVVVVNLNSNDHHHHIFQLPNLGQPLSLYGGFRIIECCGRLRAIDVAFGRGTTFPVLYIWELKENYKREDDDAWSLMHCLPFTEIIPFTNREGLSDFRKWFSDIANGILPLYSHDVTVHYFDPVDGNLVYLSLQERFFSYDMCYKTLTFHPRVKYSIKRWKHLFQVVLPLRPTPVPGYKS